MDHSFINSDNKNDDSGKLNFPSGFFWGSATSAHQVEGGNFNDWSIWEKENAARLAACAAKRHTNAATRIPDYILERYPNPLQPENYVSGRACDHYNRYEQDFDIAKELGHNAHRFSIEWSRIEPEEGKFNEAEVEHYRKVIQALKSRGLEPFVTLWHWTNPVWLAKIGGPESKKFPFYFSRYAKFVVGQLKDSARFWITLNEPTSVIGASYMAGKWPPQKKNPLSAYRVYKYLSAAHNLAFDDIHKISKEVQIGFSNILYFFEPFNKKSFFDNISVRIAKYFYNKRFLNLTGQRHDFLTLQYYFRNQLKFPLAIRNENEKVSDMGWELYPEGIYHLLKNLKKYNKPIYITENGLADARDANRGWFIKEILKNVHRAIGEGADVRGYFYWSLLDNFEWDKGFWPRFGLVKMDYGTLERKIRPSAYEYAKICKENKILV